MKNELLLLLWLFAAGCKHPSSPDLTQNTHETHQLATDSIHTFYPFPQYLTEQLAYLDSVPLAVERVVKVNGRTTDSGFIEKKLFSKAIQEINDTDPNVISLQGQFKESSFQDLTLNSLTFSITAQEPSSALRSADVLLNPVNKKVRTIILRKNFQRGDTVFIQNFLWTHSYRCQLSEEILVKNHPPLLRVTSYVWDSPPKSSIVD